ncbi:bifunctional 3-(3-hydroxy-phenyl)propionate/3-hydroxycinnamic acid hydroxylase MhpA [Rhodococcus zopfii]|uniref:bifunctional 3-(3-hydroxy-phenyl)propionate/3-hydroxycinnamic acid hydroxylase MhpA n=1 Tax=Rhodococcus zopfii TaxID=43772 RepID=UPI001110FE38|nr:bifunctional 3-(3-hydroxy-phenyl)propionate/3-hydroxycinnamic acid hydroxylase [Rhodococcus zopfii]
MTAPHYPVVIVGAGPTGVTSAIQLAQYGIDTLVLDRWEDVYPQPRAVHLDDEVFRIVARLGLADAFGRISRPGKGLRLLDRDMTVLAEFKRDSARGVHGFPQANMFDQPEFEHLLRMQARRHDSVHLRGNSEVTGLLHERGQVRVDFTDRTTGDRSTVRADYVLGCDGANSIVRSSIGSRMQDLGFEQTWLVVDIATDAELHHWEGVHQVCDPHRSATYMRIGDRRYRWEFRLRPDESATDYSDLTALRPLLAPWVGDYRVTDLDLELVRLASYTFRARVADRWRDRNVFLLGDAAHLTPPFVGQGMGAGLRDAANLAWKLAGVLNRTLPEGCLESYEHERKPHAKKMIQLAVGIGWAMTEGGDLGQFVRRRIAPVVRWIPNLRTRVTDSATPPLGASTFVRDDRMHRGRAGTLCPNTEIGDTGTRVDEVAQGRFLVITSIDPTPGQRREIERRGAFVVLAPTGSELGHWLSRGHANAAIVRPDGTVMAAGRSLANLHTMVPALCVP